MTYEKQNLLEVRLLWHIPHYPQSEDPVGITTFLKKGNVESQHYRRASWGFTLPRVMEEFVDAHTFEGFA